MRQTILITLLLLSGCFPFAGGNKDLPGPYELEISEDGKIFWLHGPGERDNGGGILNGDVRQLGWSENYIVAYRHSTFRADPDGWMVVDVRKQTIAGPLSEVRAREIVGTPEVTVRPASEAWKQL